MMVVVVTPPAIMVMMVMTTPPAIVVMVVSHTVMMMVMMILHQRHVRLGPDGLTAARSLGGVHGLQYGKRVRDRLKQFGVRPRRGQPGRVRAFEAGRLGAIEGGQA
jgi:hypothetical protein